MQHEMEEIRSVLVKYRDGEIGALNIPHRLDNGVTILLKSWRPSHEYLTIEISIPQYSKVPEGNQDLSDLGEHFEAIVDDFNSLLEELDYPIPESYTHKEDNAQPFGPYDYEFVGKIKNPRN